MVKHRLKTQNNTAIAFLLRFAQKLSNTGEVMDMPVPSSFNDITTDVKMRDYSGWVWYDREFYTPSSWDIQNTVDIWLRIGSAHYSSRVWLNGIQVTKKDTNSNHSTKARQSILR